MYGVSHAHFLQHMLKHGVLSIEKALQFFRKVGEEAVKDVDSLTEFASEINEKISAQDLQIQFAVCEVTGEKLLVLVNIANDDVSKMQNVFSQVELEYFQVLLNNIITSRGKKLAHVSCLSLSSALTKKLNMTNAEKLLKKWIRAGYLSTKDDNIHLGARCIAEFAIFFPSHCKDHITQCHLCCELVFTGRTCSHCKKIMHSHCLGKFLTKRNCCPDCKQEWHDYEEEEKDVSPSEEEEHNDTTNSDKSDN